MKHGQELINELREEIRRLTEAQARRRERIDRWETDEDDCFLSDRVEERGIRLAKQKIQLIEKGGCEWFPEYATTDGKLVNAKWCNTRYGSSLRVEMPDGSVVWCSGGERSMKNKGIKRVFCLRPAWFAFRSPYSGMMGVYCGDYELFPSNWNYATGEEASTEPIEIKDC